jgi:dienelactone hydrolase
MRKEGSLLAVALIAAGCAEPLPPSSLKFPANGDLPGNLGRTTVLRPSDGSGPFPAVVLLPTCGGVQRHLFDWARRLNQAGYVAMIVDSNGPRGVTQNCQGSSAPVTLDNVVSDADAALAYLRRQPFVRGDRLGVIGFSWGAMAAIRLAGQSHQARLADHAAGLRAVAAFYPGCGTDSPDPLVQATYEWDAKFATPVLLLLGESDNEAPFPYCARKAESHKRDGEPTSYKVYPNTTHMFDSVEIGPQGREIWHGSRGPFVYRYNSDVTQDAWGEVRTMFDRYLKDQP